ILLDINMPGMDGFETASLIRQRVATQHTPIIFVTASNDDEHLTRGYSLGAVDFIQAPFSADVLRAKVSVFVELAMKTDQVRHQAVSLRRRATQLQKLAAASMAINGALSIDKMLQTVTDTARDIIDTHQAITLFLLNAATARRLPRTLAVSSFSEKYADWRERQLALDPIASTILAQSQTASRLTASELREHPDWDVIKNLDIPPIVGGILAAPLMSREGHNFGVIYLSDHIDGEFRQNDEAVLVQLAQMASIAIENSLFAEDRETNRIKDEFLATLSHELRTPLNAILGWTQLLRMEKLPEETAYGVDVIERNAKAQAKLVEDMLDVSRVTTGKMNLKSREIDLPNVVQAAIDTASPAANAKDITIDWINELDPTPMFGDPDRLQQVIWNLLSNAVKFTQNGGRVEVRTDRTNGYSRICISDNGPGINPKFLPHVFDRFRQADATSTRSHGGLGIGLAIVRHIVELHGGRVQADSLGEGHGAKFTVELPATPPKMLAEAPTRTAPAATESRPANSNGPVDLKGIRVLVVDDEGDAREVIAQLLRRSHAEVITAASATDALEQLARQCPDIMISDIAMPDCDGYELLRNARRLPHVQKYSLPAIALTAYASEEDRRRALSCGFEAHIAKPVDGKQLLTVIASLFPARPNHVHAEASSTPQPAELPSQAD
ncbi:MAG TPA: response regulator, partial [Tepidisphaeraceae bacterium]|nr:response regulator [Tepidisphaeraceae bacterium]